jgi:hypothetical protein
VNAWAGIESTAEISAPSRTNAPGAVASAHVTLVPLRRQQRPVLGAIDIAGHILARHFRTVVVGSAAILLPGLAMNLIASSLAFDRARSLSNVVSSLPEMLGAGRAATGVESVLWYLSTVINSLAAALVGGYVTTLVIQHQIGIVPSARTAFSALFRRLPVLFLAWLIGHVWIIGGAMILGRTRSNSTGLIVLGAGVAFTMLIHTILVSPAIIAEGIGPFAGLKRSWKMARRQPSTVSGFVIATMLVGSFVQYGITLLPRALNATGFVPLGRFSWAFESVAGQLGRMIGVPLIAMATAQIYLELRMTTEGMDLIAQADRSFPVRTAT